MAVRPWQVGPMGAAGAATRSLARAGIPFEAFKGVSVSHVALYDKAHSARGDNEPPI